MLTLVVRESERMLAIGQADLVAPPDRPPDGFVDAPPFRRQFDEGRIADDHLAALPDPVANVLGERLDDLVHPALDLPERDEGMAEGTSRLRRTRAIASSSSSGIGWRKDASASRYPCRSG